MNESKQGTLQPGTAATVAYNLLLRTYSLSRRGNLSPYWDRAWALASRVFSGPVRTLIHEQPVLVSFGHAYPLYARRFPTYNNPLIELIYQTHLQVQRPVTLIDIGANVGDTIVMISANCPDMLGDFVCIEGDEEFFLYLQHNLRCFEHGKLVRTLLSDSTTGAHGLVRTHAGSASAQAGAVASSATLDSVATSLGLTTLDLLKSDVDGYDGRVLNGATTVLSTLRPTVIFEWHPILCEKTGSSPLQHFEVLEACGYSTFLWFDKYGNFSHLNHGYRQSEIEALVELSRRNKVDFDLHYDVVALHATTPLSYSALAELGFARRRRSQY